MLLPREHGAYAQLLFPLLCALLVGHPRLGAYLLAVAAAGAFLAHESLLVVLGQRGIRATREQGGDARRSLAIFGGTALVAGGAALVVLPAEALVALGAGRLLVLERSAGPGLPPFASRIHLVDVRDAADVSGVARDLAARPADLVPKRLLWEDTLG